MLLTFGKEQNYKTDHLATIKYMLERAGEDDGICKVIYFDERFNNALKDTNTPDLIACYLGTDGSISFSAHSKDDNEQTFPISWDELPARVQMMVFGYLSYNSNWQEYGEMLIQPNGRIRLLYTNGREGKFYKNTLNFEQKRGICYVSEFGFEELEDYYAEHQIMENNLTEEQLIEVARKEGISIFTHQDFYDLAMDTLSDLNLPTDEQSAWKFARHIFDMVEWETPSTYVSQLDTEDIEEILERNNDD